MPIQKGPANLGTGVIDATELASGSVTPAKLSTGGPTWDTSGNVGIGTSSINTRLNVKSVNNTYTGGALALESASAVKNYITSISDTIYFGNSTTVDMMALNANGIALGPSVTAASSGVGIKFPATQAASSDANTLDDYEEGTWTPTLNFSGGAGTLSYGTRTGYYTKIGRVVYISMNLIFSKGTASGTMDNISGLPFTSAESFGSGALIDNMSGLTGAPVWITQSNLAYIYMTNTGALGSINATSMGASSNVFRFAGYYNI
jgi:hypothetical protein